MLRNWWFYEDVTDSIAAQQIMVQSSANENSIKVDHFSWQSDYIDKIIIPSAMFC
jgi:hypothetical protein